MAEFRRNKNGERVVFGPPSEVQAGRNIGIANRDGVIRRVDIVSVGRVFDTPDGPRVYGYLRKAEDRPRVTTAAASQRRGMCMECNERRAVADATDSSGIRGEVCTRCQRMPSSQRSFF